MDVASVPGLPRYAFVIVRGWKALKMGKAWDEESHGNRLRIGLGRARPVVLDHVCM